MVVVVFRNRVTAGVEAEYEPRAAEILALVRKMPGFVSFKGFAADDGERLALSEWETLEYAREWGHDLEHQVAQQQGRDRFYSEYSLKICEATRVSQFSVD